MHFESPFFDGWPMQSAISIPAVLLFCVTLLWQSATLATRPQTFHIRGTITDSLEAVIRGVKVTFRNEQLTMNVTTDNQGFYEAELPLGEYTMTAQGPPGFPPYERPLFRVTSPASAILNVTLLVENSCGDAIIVDSSGESFTADQWKAATIRCRGEDRILIPSNDGLPLQLFIRYGTRKAIGEIHSYTGEKTGQYQAPVFLTYNLFSLRAYELTYDAKNRMIVAHGNVVAVNELGSTIRAYLMTFKIENDQVISTP
jgi:hypothetical protein